jgi:uncharacterized membrane protein YtjA (UPF0391 family)
MLTVVVVLLSVALLVALFGRGHIGPAFAQIAKNIFCAVLLVFVVAALAGAFRRSDLVPKTITAADRARERSPHDVQS